MYKFSQRSLKNLSECDERLQRIAKEAIKKIDFTIIDGMRTQEESKKNKEKGTSWTNKSKHCLNPSKAFDFIPYPFKGWENLKSFEKVAKVLKEVAKELDIKVRWGGDWNMNDKCDDEIIRGTYDGGHFELMEGDEKI